MLGPLKPGFRVRSVCSVLGGHAQKHHQILAIAGWEAGWTMTQQWKGSMLHPVNAWLSKQPNPKNGRVASSYWYLAA